ncbi:MAG TPA: ABC transporter ATP-binding protein [Acidimicrobiales bacterium]|nr:ABC transporter ATP-binding protein [Acidimicrobiales bacterium]
MTSYSSQTADVPRADGPPDRRGAPEASPERPASGGVPAAPMVEAHGLTKRFGSFVAVDGVSFTIAKGESFGFLGPNGAGKTSTMRMVSCISPISDGTLRVLGMDPATDGAAIRARMGICPQEDSLDLELTVMDNLMIYGRYFDLPRKVIRRRAEQLLEFAQLTERANDRVDPLSGGMKRRLTIARALISDPDLLILDEPTTGLDPQARHLLWDRLYRLKLEGVTLIITTHYMDEAEQLCDRLVVMDRGRFAAEGSPRQLIEQHSTKEVVELRFLPGAHEEVALALAGLAERHEVLPDRLLLYTDEGDATLAEVHAQGFTPQSTLVRRSTLEDVFLRLTGRTLVD